MNYKKFNKILIIFTPLILILIMVFNYIIDPYFVFNSPQIKGINIIKNNTISDEMSKFYVGKRSNAEVLLIGTSRTDHINPEYLKKYALGKVYNLAVPGSVITTQKNILEYFIKKGNITTVIYGLDFFSFSPELNNFNDSLKNKRYLDDYLNDYLDSLLSIRTLKKSIKTVKENIKNSYIKRYHHNGWGTFKAKYIEIEKYGNKQIKENIIKELKVYSSKKGTFNYASFKNPDSINNSLNELEEIIKLCKVNNIKIYMFISPVYSEFIDLIYSRGYYNTYTYWKKELSKHGNIYDFSGYNSITTDISNYIDGSHYQTKLAPLMFAKMFNDDSVDVPADFGTVLTVQNIDKILQKQEEQARHK